MINRLPWHKKLRTSSANNLDKINEIVDYINHSDISEVALSESVSGRIVQADKATSLKDLTVYGESNQNGTPTPESPVPVQVVKGRNLLTPRPRPATTTTGITFTANNDGSIDIQGTATADTDWVISNPDANPIIVPAGNYVFSIEGLTSGVKFIVSGGGYNGFPYREMTIDSTNATGAVTDSARPFSYIILRVLNGTTVNTTVYPQLEIGSTATPYVPYGNIGLKIGDTVTPIDLQGNVLASLPDGTHDTLKIDSAGHVTIDKRVGYIASYDDESIGDVYISTTGELSTGASVYYKLTTSTTVDIGYITPPAIYDNDEMQIIATITPLIDVGYWSYPEFTEMIADLKAYVDYKTADESSTLGLHLLNPINIREDLPSIEPFEISGVLESEEQ